MKNDGREIFVFFRLRKSQKTQFASFKCIFKYLNLQQIIFPTSEDEIQREILVWVISSDDDSFCLLLSYLEQMENLKWTFIKIKGASETRRRNWADESFKTLNSIVNILNLSLIFSVTDTNRKKSSRFVSLFLKCRNDLIGANFYGLEFIMLQTNLKKKLKKNPVINFYITKEEKHPKEIKKNHLSF